MAAIEAVKSTIGKVCETIQDLYAMVRPPLIELPSILLVCSLVKRPGLSSIVSLGNIVSHMAQYGIPTEPGPDGSENIEIVKTKIMLDEIYRALHEDAQVQGGTKPMTMNIGYNGGTLTNFDCGVNLGTIR